MYDYLAKIILLGPSGAGKSCLLHRFVKNEWRVLTSQTIGVEFASKIVKVGTGSRRKRIKLQLWDTAGTERFRSVSRSYYRGAAGAVLVYDITNHSSFRALSTFLNDARALASPELTVVLAGNKVDRADESASAEPSFVNSPLTAHLTTPSTSFNSRASDYQSDTPRSMNSYGLGSRDTATVAPEGREVSPDEASSWASIQGIPVSLEVSAFTGENVDEVFSQLARMILTKIELGEINPDDPQSGIQYGDSGGWGTGGSDGASVKSGMTMEDGSADVRRRRSGRSRGANGWSTGLREWEEVFHLDGRRRGTCC
ncbi:GTP-binding protein YPTC4 [Trichodelitschia bisporula]|uniref:GTP-binding protein YPTC4 n=1 Tax=Trichodelitschia bisporula TaxID=703511 RepID=A0A6G1I0L2_9PEZI|nr:GTP-binding protein YPTC4 [Trichodelitschia bisporula]